MTNPLDPDEAQAQLDRLGRNIAQARSKIEQDRGKDGDEEHYLHSGEEGDDDQTIAP